MKDYETLDPSDWEETRKLGHQMMDDAISYLSTLRDRPVWQEMPDEIREHFTEGIPMEPQAAHLVYEAYKNNVMPYTMGNTHPRFWAWYMGNGTILGAMADFLTSVITPNAGAGNHAGQLVEHQVISWMLETIGYPSDASGILVSGGSMANYVGLTVARHIQSGYDIRKQGVRKGEKQMVVYASTEVHSCNQKAVELLGLGSKYLRKIPVKKDYTINIKELKKRIKKDRKKGLQPICVIASAGTVNTGAIDNLPKIADLCEKEGLWMHVDGAIGGIAMLSEVARKQLQGIERSDSIALDLHKWMHVPFEAGCVLVKNRKGHQASFALTPEYLEQNTRGLASGTHWFSEYGIQLSRRMRSLKVWMTLKENGADKIGRMITRNIDQAQHLAARVREEPSMELVAKVGLDIVCLRYVVPELPLKKLNKINKEILVLLHERGLAVPSYTTLNGVYCIRVAIANHRSTYEDFDFLADKVIEIGNELVQAK